MKKTIISLFAMCVAFVAAAQDFTVANSEGVNISYHVRSDGVSLNVVAANYSGRVVIPDTVVYEGTSYVVTNIAKAFMGSSVTYLHVPATVTSLQNGAFVNCNQLDTLSFGATEPPTVSYDDPYNCFSLNYDLNSLVIMVPCGSLQTWHAAWGRLAEMRSDCAWHLVIVADDPYMYYAGSCWLEEDELIDVYYYLQGNQDFKAVLGVFHADGTMYDWRGDNYLHGHDTLYLRSEYLDYSNFGSNLVSTRVYAFGNMSYDGSNGFYSVVPSGASTLYANGLWVGSRGGYAAAHTYISKGNDYVPGPLPLGLNTLPDFGTVQFFNHVWHLTREQIDYHIAHCGEAGYEPIDDIASWPGNGPDGYAQQLAPFFDADSDGVYQPLAGDYPIIRGDECTFSIFNDMLSRHQTTYGIPMGVEVHCMTYAFNEPEDTALWNTVFTHYDIFNRSTYTYDSTYLAAWTDFDIGHGYDDYIGCDVRRGMYYGYNGDNADGPGTGSFAGVPPAQSCTFLGGPWQQADGKDNSKVDIEYILSDACNNTELKSLLEEYRTPDGQIDTAAVNTDADIFYAIDYRSWHFIPGDDLGNQAINGAGFGNGITDDERIGMTGFMSYLNGNNAANVDPSYYMDYYNYMRSRWCNGYHLYWGGDGCTSGTEILDANYMYPGDSDPWLWGTGGTMPTSYINEWTEATVHTTPGDRRGLASSGSFSFQPSGTRADGRGFWQEIDLAYTTAFGTSTPMSSVDALRLLTDEVRRQWQYDTTDSGRPFTYMPFSAPHEVNGIDEATRCELTIYPNPTTGMVYIDVPHDAVLQLFDMVGHCVMTTRVAQGTAALDLGRLPQGVYLVRVDGAVSRLVKR